MRKYIFIQLFFISLFSHSQTWESNGYINSDVSIPRIRQAETFFYTEYEFLLNVNHKTLTEIEAEIKSNPLEEFKYIVSKTNQNSTKVEKYIKGNIFSEKTYKNNVLNGVTKIYYPDGTIFQEVDFVNGKVKGLYKIYSNDRDHKVILETNYKNGIRNGIRKYFIPREEEVLEGNYVDGNLVGDLKFTTEYGYYLLPNDLKKGKVQGFSNNKLISEFYIINEKDIHGEATIYFYDVNKIAMKIPYYLGEKNGTARMYDREGKEINKIEYKHDKKVGDYINYTKDKQVSSEEHYDDEGNRTGIWKEYKNGLIYSEQSYKNNKLDGAYKLYKNGVLQNVEEYKKGFKFYYSGKDIKKIDKDVEFELNKEITLKVDNLVESKEDTTLQSIVINGTRTDLFNLKIKGIKKSLLEEFKGKKDVKAKSIKVNTNISHNIATSSNKVQSNQPIAHKVTKHESTNVVTSKPSKEDEEWESF